MNLLDKLETAHLIAQSKIDFDDVESVRRVTDARREYDMLLFDYAEVMVNALRRVEQEAQENDYCAACGEHPSHSHSMRCPLAPWTDNDN